MSVRLLHAMPYGRKSALDATQNDMRTIEGKSNGEVLGVMEARELIKTIETMRRNGGGFSA